MLIAGLYLATGLTWTGRSLLEVMAHPDYWDPATTIDWIAVWTYSLALSLTAVSVPFVARDARAGRLVGVIALIVGCAAGLAAIGNAMEDGFDVGAASTVYVIGALGTLIGLLALAAGLWIRDRPRSALVVVLMMVGLASQSLGLGWLVLIGCAIAARDHLGARRQPDEARA